MPQGYALQPVDIDHMVKRNADMMAIIEQVTVKKIYAALTVQLPVR